MDNLKTSEGDISWEIRIPVLHNPLLWYQLLIVSLLSSGFILVLLVGLNLFEDNWEQIPESFFIWAVLAGGLFLAFTIILMFISRGIVTRYTVSERGTVQETLTKYERFMKKASLFALFLGDARGMTAAGAGMLAKSREIISAGWKEISNIEVFPSRFEIRLKNQWRTVMQIVCFPENFQAVMDIVRENVSIKPSDESDSVFSQIVSTALVLLLGVFLFPRLPIHVPAIFIIPMMFFAFPAVWSTAKLQKVSAAIILVALVSGISLAFYFGEVDFSGNGAGYAFFIEFLSFSFFAFIAFRVFLLRK